MYHINPFPLLGSCAHTGDNNANHDDLPNGSAKMDPVQMTDV